MAIAKSTRESRRVRFTRTFVREVASGKRPGRWTDTESPLKVKSVAGGAQYYVERKVSRRAVTVVPKDSTGAPIQRTATLWTLEHAKEWALGAVGDLVRGIDPKAARAPATPTFEALAQEHLATSGSSIGMQQVL